MLYQTSCFAVCRPNEIGDVGSCETLADLRATLGLGTLATQSGTHSASVNDFSTDTIADDQVWVGDSSSTGTFRTMPSCSGATTEKLLYNNTTNAFSCGTDQGGAAGTDRSGGGGGGGGGTSTGGDGATGGRGEVRVYSI